MYQMITLDMDGTLLNEDKVITTACKEAMHKAKEAGKYIVIATGRAISELEDYREDFADVHYIIAESGALLYDWQKQAVLAKDCFREEDVEALYALSLQQDILVQWFVDGQAYVNENQVHRMADYEMGIYQSLFDVASIGILDMDAFVKEHKTNVEKINLYHRTVENRGVTFEKVQEMDVDKVFAEITSIEFSPKGVHKGNGLLKLCEYLHVDVKETISVGDSYNDMKILETAGLAVAMKNSKEEVLAMADVVVADNDHDGCAEAITQYLLA